MTKAKGKAKRVFNNMTMKRPSSKNRQKKSKIKMFETRHQSNLKRLKVERGQQFERKCA
ncbi:hypothetical protein VPH219E481_0052 [Vibrio phage 219E48-1]|nr:hypothetical protein PODOV021v1_p0040 [Vibrio phage 219E41.2]QZI91093.1 hypothetical protein PODOV032v1_p0088 [Vibrio phage 219E41.1]QZI91178.1 hypothetical protein PODOV060v1_p0084 [Vibrio phage 234P8]QZI91531.1 hypothetical protein PODOV087v1_p0026 [Vibrio phage 431E45.1]QZI91607.1 hypothetical protein PODOV086v1_p0023 [Vibrio phage 431E46.1]QZI91717.1 hypothetical protein PODOV088v1_p0056 [Vibrio phage 431E48.2]